MSDEKNENPGVVSIPVAEYESMKSDALRYYGQAESAGREAAALRAERDTESIARWCARRRRERAPAPKPSAMWSPWSAQG